MKILLHWICEGVGEGDYVCDNLFGDNCYIDNLMDSNITGLFYHYLQGNFSCDCNRFDHFLSDEQQEVFEKFYPDASCFVNDHKKCTRYIKTQYFKIEIE